MRLTNTFSFRGAQHTLSAARGQGNTTDDQLNPQQLPGSPATIHQQQISSINLNILIIIININKCCLRIVTSNIPSKKNCERTLT